MMMTASTIAPMAMAMPPRDMMLELMPCAIHHQERNQHRDGQDEDGHERAAQVQQKREAHQRHDDAFLDQLFFERLHRALDERAAVVGDGDTARPAGRPFIASSSFFFTSRMTCRAFAP